MPLTPETLGARVTVEDAIQVLERALSYAEAGDCDSLSDLTDDIDASVASSLDELTEPRNRRWQLTYPTWFQSRLEYKVFCVLDSWIDDLNHGWGMYDRSPSDWIADVKRLAEELGRGARPEDLRMPGVLAHAPSPAQEPDATSGSCPKSRRACSIAACIGIIALIAAVVIPNLMASRVQSNEARAVAALRAYVRAQEEFRKKDRYGTGKRVYANLVDGGGFPDLFEIGGPHSGGKKLELIDESVALASQQRGRSLYGYYFLDITEGPSGPFDYASQHGLSAYPGPFSGRGGVNCFIVNESGRVYMKYAPAIPGCSYDQLNRGEVPKALRKWPADLEAEGFDGRTNGRRLQRRSSATGTARPCRRDHTPGSVELPSRGAPPRASPLDRRFGAAVGGKTFLMIRGKGGRSARMLLRPGALRAIDRWLDVSGHVKGPKSPLFVNLSHRPEHRGKGIKPEGLYHIIKARFPGYSPHSLRSRSITDVWAASGENLHMAQLFARHASPAVTERVYIQAHKLEKALRFAPNYS